WCWYVCLSELPTHHPDLHSFPTRRSSDLKVVIFEEFISNQKKIMSEIFEFLDVEDQPTLVNQAHNISGKPKNRVINKFLTRNNIDRKSTRLNSSHVKISYAVFCLKKKNKR